MFYEVKNNYKYNGQIIELQIGDTVKVGKKTANILIGYIARL